MFIMSIKNIIVLPCSLFICFMSALGQQEGYKRIVALKERYLLNPEYYKKHFPGYNFKSINPYELRALVSLEVRKRIKRGLQQDPLFLKADRLIILVTSTLLSQVSSADEAIVEWRKIPQLLGRSRADFTKIQQAILDVSDEKIKSFYALAEDCNNKIDVIAEGVKKRIVSNHSIHDKLQCDQTATRSIDLLKARNITMSIEDKHLDQIIKAYNENPDRPILEQLKNHKIFNIGNFDNSKGAFIVHDIYDHFWFMMKLEDEGIFSRYATLLFSLGNPHLCDIFSREGEIVATIATHFRWFHFAEEDYRPLLSMEDIKTILAHSRAQGDFTENQARAYALIESLDQNSMMYKALPFILSDMNIQMLKYITFNGYPKKLNDLYQSEGYFDPLDPECVAFVTECTYYLFAHYEHVKQVLFNVTMWIENYLVGIAKGEAKEDLTIDLKEAEFIDGSDKFTHLSTKKINWMRDHIGFEVVRYQVGDECA
jgi:hypothetical protein